MKSLNKINRYILYFTILATSYFVLQDWTPISLFVAGVLVLNNLPHLLLLWINRKMNPESRRKTILSLFGTILISGQALFNYVNALYIHPDAQGGLVFLFLPLYLLLQIVIVYLTFKIATKIQRFSSKKSS